MTTIKTEYVNEAAFRKDVVKYAKENGWTVMWTIDSPFKPSSGFPDLTLAKEWQTRTIHGRQFKEEDGAWLLFRELKQPGKYLRPEQDDWRRLLELAGQDYDVWYPKDAEAIMAALGEPPLPTEPMEVKVRE